MRDGLNLNREVMIYDERLHDWRELDDFEHRYSVAGAELEERIVLRRYGVVERSWEVWRNVDRRQTLRATENLIIGEDEPSWSDWLDYANALTFAAHQQDRLEI